MNEQAAEAPPATPPAKSNAVRQVVLIALLVVAIAALYYDKQVAIPTLDKTFQAVEARNSEINASADRRAMTSEDVQDVVGMPPSSVEKVNKYTVERYNVSKLPLFPRYYYAQYTSNDDGGLTFRSHALKWEELDLSDPNKNPPPPPSTSGTENAGPGAAAPAGDDSGAAMDDAAGDATTDDFVPDTDSAEEPADDENANP